MISSYVHNIDLVELAATGRCDTHGGAAFISFSGFATESRTVLEVHCIDSQADTRLKCESTFELKLIKLSEIISLKTRELIE